MKEKPMNEKPMNENKSTLGHLAARHPAAAKVFYRYGLDYCCGGAESLESACSRLGLNPEAVLAEIDESRPLSADTADWNERPLGELIEHILSRYHVPLRAELPRLIGLADAVERVHAENASCPRGLAAHLRRMRDAVEGHLEKEEQILFPLLLAGRGAMAHMPIRVMSEEHEDHGQNLRRLHQLTAEFTLPEEACASWRELYRSLAVLEEELMNHIHLENNVLFPRALAQ